MVLSFGGDRMNASISGQPFKQLKTTTALTLHLFSRHNISTARLLDAGMLGREGHTQTRTK